MKRTRERRMLGLAILCSLILHLVVGFSLAAFGSAITPPLPMENKPVELTLVDLSATPPPTVPKDPPYLETSADRESKEKPKEQTFESNANSIAASQLPASGEIPLPSQEGEDRPHVNLETHQYSLPSEGTQPQPESQTKPASTPPAKSAPTPDPQQLALLASTPPPPIKAPDDTEVNQEEAPEAAPKTAQKPKPELAASSYRAQREQTRISGSLSNRGRSSVNAVGTPLGRYQKAVSDAIGSRWYYYMNSKMDLVSVGTAHIRAEVDADGHVQNLRIISNNANEAFANICLQSFQEAHIPPIPSELIDTLPDGRMSVDFSFTAYANR